MSEHDRLRRDPAESALNDVARRCSEGAALYADAAGRTQDASARALFRELAGERHAMADALHRAVRDMGELPEAPDPDADALHRFLNAARAALAAEPARPLLRDRERAEAELARALETALGAVPDGATRERLERFRLRVEAVRARLAAAAEGRDA